MLDNLVQLQKRLQMVGDADIAHALAKPNNSAPQFLLMMEMRRRQALRNQPMGPVPRMDMRSEMAQGAYNPVPHPPPIIPPIPAHDESGIMSLMQAPRGPQSLDMSQPAAMGSLFSGKR